MDLKKFEGMMSKHEFIQGLILAAPAKASPGSIWEKNVKCHNCLFAKSCALIREQVPLDKKINCRDIINLMFGEIKAKDFPVE